MGGKKRNEVGKIIVEINLWMAAHDVVFSSFVIFCFCLNAGVIVTIILTREKTQQKQKQASIYLILSHKKPQLNDGTYQSTKKKLYITYIQRRRKYVTHKKIHTHAHAHTHKP